jgi:hypothetical protein
MSVLGSAEDEFFAFEHIDEAGIAFHKRRGEFYDAIQNLVKSACCRKPAANFVQQIYRRVFNANQGVHDSS